MAENKKVNQEETNQEETKKCSEGVAEGEQENENSILEKIKAEGEKIIEAAKAEGAKIMEEAKAEAEKIFGKAKENVNTPGGGSPSKDKAQEYLDEYVEIQLFKDGKDYKDDVFVSVNDETIQIKRGVRTKIKRKFAMVLDLSQLQDLKTQQYIEQESGRYVAETKRLGL